MAEKIDRGEGDKEDDDHWAHSPMTDREQEKEKEEMVFTHGRRAPNDGGELCVERKVIRLLWV